MGEYEKNHLVTAAYLANWCGADGKLRVRYVQSGGAGLSTPRRVGFECRWWSSDPALNKAAEQACARLETLAPRLLRPRARWPYSDHDRGLLAEFIALHVLRSRAWRRWYEAMRESDLRRRRASWESSAEALDEFLRRARSDGLALELFEQVLGTVTGQLASMSWTLITFDRPGLVTSDQPVAPMPLAPRAGVADFAAVPQNGLLDTLEIRFSLTPTDGLLMSWAPGPERVLHGDWSQAVNFNLPILSQAEHQVFSCPDHVAAVGAGQWATSLATQLLPGYTEDSARTSDHRRLVFRALSDRIERDPDQRQPIPVLRPRSSDPLAA